MRNILWAVALIIATILWGWTGLLWVVGVWLLLFIIGMVLAALGLAGAAIILSSGARRRY